MVAHPLKIVFFFFNDTATTEIYTLSLHDALPILLAESIRQIVFHEVNSLVGNVCFHASALGRQIRDRKSTRLNSSHGYISYAVFCLKKKNPGRSTSRCRVRSRRRRRSNPAALIEV